jgi:hypothetical protein
MTDSSRPLVGDAARFLPLTPQVFHILLSLHDGPRHGYSIIQDIRHRTGGEMQLTASTLYDAVARLSDQSLIQQVPEPARDEVGDPESAPARRDKRRRYYAVTALGRGRCGRGATVGARRRGGSGARRGAARVNLAIGDV